MPLIDLQMMCSLKKLEVWAITTVMMSVIISVKISGGSVTSSNFTVHCHCLE